MAEKKKSFWMTIPGILTGIAAIITAITGLYLAINGNSENTANNKPNRTEQPPVEYIQPSKNETTDNLLPEEENKVADEISQNTVQLTRQIIASQTDRNWQSINNTDPLITQLGLDYIDLHEIVAEISIEFNIFLEAEEVGPMDKINVQMLSKAVETKQ